MKSNNTLKNKLIIFRVLVVAFVAYLLVQFGIVDNSNGTKSTELYIFAIIVALPIAILADKYIVKFAKTGSLK